MGQSPRPRPKCLAEKLRQLRELLCLTQEQLAEAVSYIESPPQPGHISEYERGRREPSLLFLLAVVRLAGVTMEVLVDDKLELPRRLPPDAKNKVTRKYKA